MNSAPMRLDPRRVPRLRRSSLHLRYLHHHEPLPVGFAVVLSLVLLGLLKLL